MTNEQKEIALRVAQETDAMYPWNMNQGPWIVEFATRLLAALPKPEPVAVPMQAISNCVNELIQMAADNGANSISMPDDYVAVAYFVSTVQPPLYTAPIDQSQRIAELERENEGLRKDAEKWRAHEAKKAELINRGFLRSPLRDDAALAAKEKS